MLIQFEHSGEPITLDTAREGDICRVTRNGQTLVAEIVRAAPGEITFRLDSRAVTAHYAYHGQTLWLALEGRTYTLARPAPPTRRGRARPGEPHTDDTLWAEMPGQVRGVSVAEGQVVEKGQTLLVLEAMKMELRVTAPFAGRVARLLVGEGQVVERGQILAELTRPDA